MKSLYKILGVKPDASAEEITKAYRRLSLKHHPDRGGSEEKFREITKAFEVLSDPTRRQMYDETGDTEKPRDPSDQQALHVLNQALVIVIRTVMEFGQKMKNIDLVEKIEIALNGSIKENKAALKNCREARSLLEDGLARVNGPEDNALSAVIRSQIHTTSEEILKLEQFEVALGKAINLLDGIKYNADLLTYSQTAYAGWAVLN